MNDLLKLLLGFVLTTVFGGTLGYYFQNRTDAAIWMLEPHRLNEAQGYEPVFPPLNARSLKPLIRPAMKGQDSSKIKVLAASPLETDLKMLTQQGAFTVHVTDERLRSARRFADGSVLCPPERCQPIRGVASLPSRPVRISVPSGLMVSSYHDDQGRVNNARFVVAEPTGLAEGTEVRLLPLDPGDWLDSEDRAALHQVLRASQEDLEADRLVDAEAVLRELRTL